MKFTKHRTAGSISFLEHQLSHFPQDGSQFEFELGLLALKIRLVADSDNPKSLRNYLKLSKPLILMFCLLLMDEPPFVHLAVDLPY